MIQFILNDLNISADLPPTTVLLDFIRKEKMLTGTKEGCREGDCGACTILFGELVKGTVKYKTINSCLMPLGDANGKHVVTVEGINQKELSPIQAAMIDDGGTQCGFCTPGFIVSMTGYFLNNSNLNPYDAIESLDGNICRCTGYAGIKRAAADSISIFENGKSDDRTHLENLIFLKFIPNYFHEIKKRLEKISVNDRSIGKKSSVIISGGTDLYVQRWESLVRGKGNLISQDKKLAGISKTGKQIDIGSATTIEELKSSKLLQEYFPYWNNYLSLFGSLPIRNRATIGGNIVNASPIGDMVNIFLALNSIVHLDSGKKKRSILLKNFYKGYKLVDKRKNELIEKISFQIPSKNSFFNFEKVSKRTHLDIASVNSSIYVELKLGKITTIHISVGGVAPIPLYLMNTCIYLMDKTIDSETIKNAATISENEISPISDARGTAEYKRLILRQLLYAHFIKLFPQLVDPENLL